MIKPLGNRTLIEVKVETETKEGIILAEEEQRQEGKVIETGSKLVKKGNNVLFSQYGPQEIRVDGKLYVIAEEDHLIAIL